MEKLEEVLKEASIETPNLGRDESYSGLQLTESQRYKGGTSIRYWM